MELEFDKEIDALLRKARGSQPRGTSAGKPTGAHLDADSIAAFAEDAVPDAIRKTYTAHLADCDSCRKALVQAALLNEPVALKAVAAAAGAPMMAAAAPTMRSAPAPAKKPPWYRPLFSSPGLAAAFGVLVLAFGFGLFYLATQRGSNTASTVALDEKPATSSAPYAGLDTNSNAAATSSMSNASNAVSNTSALASRSQNAAANVSTRTANSPVGGLAGKDVTIDGTSSETGAAPPPAAPQPSSVAGAVADKPKDEPKTEDRRDDKETTPRNRALSEDSLARGNVASKKAAGGPLRSAGPVQNQVQTNTQAYEMAVTRKVGGKTFHNSNGAWYDSAYHGQSTTNVHRGTDEFKKLDSSLRAIANDLGGVVVVLWKDKAYRIQ